jgi:hypothetical protein
MGHRQQARRALAAPEKHIHKTRRSNTTMQNANHHQPPTSTAATVPTTVVDPHAPASRRDALCAQLHVHRLEIARIAAEYHERDVPPSEIPGLRRMLAAARRARDLSWACEFELA